MSNLPPGTTHADIDDHFGGTDVVVFADATVAVSAETLAENDMDVKQDAIKRELENGNWEDIINIEIREEERI
jgi:hypothetical protein